MRHVDLSGHGWPDLFATELSSGRRARSSSKSIVFEIDHAAIVEAREQILDAAGAVASCARIVVPADLSKEWAAALRAGGFESDVAMVWIAAVDANYGRFVRRESPPGDSGERAFLVTGRRARQDPG